MEFKQPKTAQGSFGIPPHLREQIDRAQRQKLEEEKAQPEQEEYSSMPEPVADNGSSGEGENGKDPNVKGPLEVLASIGIKFTDEDAQRLIFKGFVEKDVQLFPSIGGKPPIGYTFKTLTGQEFNVVDELLSDEVREGIPMSNEGYSTRRNMWILSLGLTKANGNPIPKVDITKDIDGKKCLDLHAMAKARREIINIMSAGVITLLMRKHTTMTLAINSILEDPESALIKKP